LEFLERLRLMKGGDAPKVIFCSTENDMKHIKRALDAGADEYVMKPFDSEILVHKFIQLGLIDPEEPQEQTVIV
jgi:two-component system chemotaxis response regulator CheY